MVKTSRKFVVKLLPCPFCGSRDLRAGIICNQTYGVECGGRGVEMARTPGEKGWPRGVWKKGATSSQNFIRLHKYVLDKAIEAWNTRSVGQQERIDAYVLD